VHIERVELSHFKSFGGTAQVPLQPGFTVISGPNGSGKSNILDALLFGLGLASSKGMRAERLPDLVNQSHMGRRGTAEASVTVTFDISDLPADMGLDQAEAALAADRADALAASANGPSLGGDARSASAEPSADPQDDAEDTDDTNVIPLPTGSHLWSVTRRLRVTSQGTYTSNYAINGEPCTLGQLHEQLQRLRIYPEGYNVVLQGDVTSIISMNSRERREIIDELAGVAAFDRKINQARDKLNAVQEHEERFHIVERELTHQLERLAQDRQKAEKYQRLKHTLQAKGEWEAVLLWRQQQQAIAQLEQTIAQGQTEFAALGTALATAQTTLIALEAELDQLNQRIKAMGEDEHLALQSQIATQEAELRQIQRQEDTLKQRHTDAATAQRQAQIDSQQHQQALAELDQTIHALTAETLVALTTARDRGQQALDQQRDATSRIAASSQNWIQQQQALRRAIEAMEEEAAPAQAEQIRLQERLHQLQQQVQTYQDTLATLEQPLDQPTAGVSPTVESLQTQEAAIQQLAQQMAKNEADLDVQRQTHTRLLQEQRDKQRQLDKLEAQAQALQESQGTHATQLLLDSGLPGLCGLVAQLGKVDPRYQRALEIAAGARLGYLVVDTDQVASEGIRLLKQRRAGRATFLPVNKIRAPRFTPLSPWQRPDGFIDYAVNLIDCEPKYRDIFGYTFGSTVVFSTLEAARLHLGSYRIVTLEGEILESSGAMTGGSLNRRAGGLHFGTVEPTESAEAQDLRQRLQQLEAMLSRCEDHIHRLSTDLQQQSQTLMEQRQQHREQQLQQRQQQAQQAQQAQQRTQAAAQLAQAQQEIATTEARLHTLATTLPAQAERIQQQRQELSALEQSQTHQQWQQAQAQVRQLEGELAEKQGDLQQAQQRLQTCQSQRQQILSAQQQAQQQARQQAQAQTELQGQQQQLEDQRQGILAVQTELRQTLAQLDATLATEKSQRDALEYRLREQRTQQQQREWQRQQLAETQQQRQQQLATAQSDLAQQQAELPDPLPEVPSDLDLDALRKELRSLQRRMEAMEPVNMLALEEYNRTQERLADLTGKLSTLAEERTELLLRIETFTTLRRRAFQEAYDAVNQNFQTIFAELSDGDGHLQLDDPKDPFNGGLNLVAHPKGKPVRRLASMSGGEKSLTALSFIFALQRYRPSPFYAFDEVDMFLDGANVERLSRMIKRQAEQAQFIVVSLRRPMIEAAQRTIGVTQARGAHTQVLGIDLQNPATAQPAPAQPATVRPATR